MAVITVGAYQITPGSAMLRGTFYDEPAANAFFEYKIGEGGSVTQTHVGYVPPGTYNKVVSGLNQDKQYYFRFGILILIEWKWGFWQAFNTPSVGVKTLPATYYSDVIAIAHVEWLSGFYYAFVEYRLGEDGPIMKDGSYYKVGSPFWCSMYMRTPNSIYYYRGGIRFDWTGLKYMVWGDWVMFHNAPYVYHYRAWAIGSDGLKHIGENKAFVPKF